MEPVLINFPLKKKKKIYNKLFSKEKVYNKLIMWSA